jgi:hypothetical protein
MRQATTCRALAAVLVVLFLASVARSYHPDTGFTSLIGFPAANEEYEVPALRALPHYRYPPPIAYDGQFYAQLALDPLLRDPATDHAMDLAPYRARRILFSWTAWCLGLGRPAWVLEAFALQNVICWLILAVLLTRWLPPDSPRHLAAWSACLLSYGLLWSVRFSLLDGPSLVLLACAVIASEHGRTLTVAATVGMAVLARETNALAASVLPPPRGRRGWIRLALAFCVIALPALIWFDYIWSIYRSTTLNATREQLTQPFVSYIGAGRAALGQLRDPANAGHGLAVIASIVALHTQSAYLLVRRDPRSPWWRLALVYVPLMLTVDRSLWEPGGINRFLLPLTVGFNIVLAASPGRFWPWFVAGNLMMAPAVILLLTTGRVL